MRFFLGGRSIALSTAFLWFDQRIRACLRRTWAVLVNACKELDLRVRASIPHDGENSLQSLSSHGFEDLVVLHAPLSACEVVAAEFGRAN